MSTVRPQPLAEGRFQLIEVIGEGGMATVYRAFDQRLQRPRAIKILSPAFAQRPALRRRFLSEAQTMANLENARVVRIFDMGEDGERVFIVMELVEGGSLVDRVRAHGAMPAKMATRVTIELCEAIHAAHEASVIHRDIKPHNILLTNSGELRITDFGIAQVQQDDKAGMTRTGAVLGTWGFMAPEQKTNAKQVDARADVYSIGGTLWSLLKNDTPPELFMADAEPEWYEAVPDPLMEVIKRSTRYRREDRYPSARAMADALRAILPLLPDDPADTPELVPRMPMRQSNAEVIDTLAQLDPDTARRGPPEGTMVPEARGPASGATLNLNDDQQNGPSALDDPPPSTRPTGMRWVPVLAIGVAVIVAGVFVWVVSPGAGAPQLPLPPVTAPVTTVLSPPITPPVAPAPAAAPVVEPLPVVSTPTPASGDPSPKPPVDTAKPPVVKEAPPVAAPVVAPVVVAPVTPTPPVVVQVEPKAPSVPAGKLSTSAPTTTSVGSTVTVSATVGGKNTVKLYYRGGDGGAFREKMMSGTGSTYSASFKVDESMATGVQYFVQATDPSGKTVRDGSGMAPIRISVGP
ncbi:hypothetical protein LBMAG42_36200 [Deltaproteobacteria bacterium]|nr:hypothetical protein LBMAG42_36200 [Deltaproteobacteria bacterium]